MRLDSAGSSLCRAPQSGPGGRTPPLPTAIAVENLWVTCGGLVQKYPQICVLAGEIQWIISTAVRGLLPFTCGNRIHTPVHKAITVTGH